MELLVLFALGCNGRQIDELVGRLKAYGLFTIWEAAARAFYQDLPFSKSELSEAGYSKLMQSCLLPLLRHKEENPHTAADCCCLAKAAALLLQHAQKQAHISTTVFTSLLLQTVKLCCEQPADKLMLGELLHELLELNMFVTALAEVPRSPCKNSKVVSLVWNPLKGDKGDQLPLFADAVCHQFPGVKTPNQIINLCRCQTENKPFTVPHRHLCAVLVLFDLMHLCHRLWCGKSRGLMLFLGQNIIAPKGEEKYNMNLFRLNKSRALACKANQQQIKMAVSEIFFTYCTGDDHKKVFEKYFL